MVNTILKKRRLVTKSLIVHILIATFGVSAWLGINAIFVELPILVNSSKEWNLPMYIVILVQVANIGPLSYVLARKFGYQFHESRWIFGMLTFGAIVMCLLSFFYEKTVNIDNKEYSFVLFIVTFFTALINCSSSLLFMPYLRYFREIYLVSYFIGEGISGILPSIVALIQGTGSSQCDTNDGTLSQPRFSSRYYFIAIFVLLLLSLVAFLLLDTLHLVKDEMVKESPENGSEIGDKIENDILDQTVEIRNRGKNFEIQGQEGERNGIRERVQNFQMNEEVSARSVEEIPEGRKENSESKLSIKNEESREMGQFADNGGKLKSSLRIYLYFLLGVMCLLGNGFLPGIQSYSSLPYGNKTYHLTATLSQLANPAACFLVMLLPSTSSRLINWLSTIAFVISCYVIYLAFKSPRPPLQHSMLGQVLIILSWILLIGLISYVKLSITTKFRHETQTENLFRIGIVMQVGSAAGALVSFLLSSFTSLLNSYDSCVDKL